TVHKGIANYWIANEVSVRSANINVLTAGYGFLATNAWELCDNRDFSFILVDEERDQPNMDPIVKEIGPPSSSQRIQLGRFGSVQVLFYDAELLDKKIIQPARAAARSTFPNFQCFNTARSEVSRH